MNKTHKILRGGGLLLSLCDISLLSVGFSGWISQNIPSEASIDVSVGDVVSIDYLDSIYYVLGSERFFSYYVLDGEYFFTNTSVYFDICLDYSRA